MMKMNYMRKNLFFAFFIYLASVSSVFASSCNVYNDQVQPLDFGDQIRVPSNAKTGTIISNRNMPHIPNTQIASSCFGNPYLHFKHYGNPTAVSNTFSTNIPGIGMRIKASVAPSYFTNPESIYRWPSTVTGAWYTIQPITVELIVTGPFASGELALSDIAKYSINGVKGVVYRNVRQTKIITPEICIVNNGSDLNVDFGNIGAGLFETAGQKPSGYTPITTTVPVSCNNAAAARNVKVSLAATAAPGMSSAIRTSNPDVGIVVQDINDRTVRPNVDTLPLRLTSTGGGRNEGTVTMKAFPVSTTGKKPSIGNFTATAAITVTFD